MENCKQFKIILDLSNFFRDHRSVARIFVKKNFKIIEDIENRIKSIFEIDNFYLSTQNQFLPSCEDVRILDNNDVIHVIKKDPNVDCGLQNTINEEKVEKVSKKKKKDKKKIEVESPVVSIEEKPVKKTKKRKKLIENIDEVETPAEKIRKSDSNNNHNETTKKPKISNVTQESPYNSSHFKLHYKKSEIITPSIDLFHKHGKINLVKIENIENNTNNLCKTLPNGDNEVENSNQSNSEEKTNNCMDETPVINGFHQLPVSRSSSIVPNNGTNDNFLDYTKPNSSLLNGNGVQDYESLNGFEMKVVMEPSSSNCSSIIELKKPSSPVLSVNADNVQPLKPVDLVLNINEVNENHSLNLFDMPEIILSRSSSTVALNRFEGPDCVNIKSPILSCDDNQSIKSNPISNNTVNNSLAATPEPNRQFNRPGLGVGQLLQSLRSTSANDSESNSEFVTVRRKRRRVRKRKPKQNRQSDCVISPTDVSVQEPSIIVTKPINSLAQPSIHLKFNESSNEESQLEEAELSFGSIFNPTDENIRKGVEMINLKPKIGDYVGFKILRLTDNFTPELSSFFVGKILKYDPNTTETYFQILYDDLKNPLENVNETYIWNDLKDTRLLHP